MRAPSLLLLALASACSSSSVSSGSAGGCKTAYPASQGPSQPCCAEWGPDACGASLFCAAFDGRTQTTCYANYSRLDGQTCTADAQCASGACAASGGCKASPGNHCDPAVGCGTPLGGSGAYYCGKDSMGGTACLPCLRASDAPACASGVEDGGADARPGEASTCTSNQRCARAGGRGGCATACTTEGAALCACGAGSSCSAALECTSGNCDFGSSTCR